MTKRPANLAILAFLAVQLALPIRGVLTRPTEGTGAFSWNMYSRRYACTVEYGVDLPNGRSVSIDWDGEAFFKETGHASRVLHRAALPAFHAYLCEEVAAQYPSGRLTGRVEAFYNDEPPVLLVEPAQELCGE